MGRGGEWREMKRTRAGCGCTNLADVRIESDLRTITPMSEAEKRDIWCICLWWPRINHSDYLDARRAKNWRRWARGAKTHEAVVRAWLSDHGGYLCYECARKHGFLW